MYCLAGSPENQCVAEPGIGDFPRRALSWGGPYAAAGLRRAMKVADFRRGKRKRASRVKLLLDGSRPRWYAIGSGAVGSVLRFERRMLPAGFLLLRSRR